MPFFLLLFCYISLTEQLIRWSKIIERSINDQSEKYKKTRKYQIQIMSVICCLWSGLIFWQNILWVFFSSSVLCNVRASLNAPTSKSFQSSTCSRRTISELNQFNQMFPMMTDPSWEGFTSLQVDSHTFIGVNGCLEERNRSWKNVWHAEPKVWSLSQLARRVDVESPQCINHIDQYSWFNCITLRST